MKASIIIFLSALLLLSGCSNEINVDIEEEIPSLVILGNRWIRLDEIDTKDSLYIKSGNGDYRIVNPKKMTIGNNKVAFSDKYIQTSIRGKYIYVNLTSAGEELDYFDACFLVVDGKQQKRVFNVETPTYGIVIGKIDALEERLLNDDSYWNY